VYDFNRSAESVINAVIIKVIEVNFIRSVMELFGKKYSKVIVKKRKERNGRVINKITGLSTNLDLKKYIQ